MFTPEAGGDVDGANAGHAVKEQIGRLRGQNVGEGEEARVGEVEERRVEVSVDDGGHSGVVVAGEVLKGRCETLELDPRRGAGLEGRGHDHNVIEL